MHGRDLRIGYAPQDEGLQAPMDRRRFCYYAAARGIRFEVAQPSRNYDVVIVSAGADISEWIRYPRNSTRIIFDYVDSYLAVSRRDLKGLLRGAAKFVARQNRYPLLNYWKAQEKMCRRADAIICSTPEQRAQLVAYCPNVHVILDSHASEVRYQKENYAAGEIFHLVWEGLAGNLAFLAEIREVLDQLRRTRKVTIHAITDLEYGRYLKGKLARRPTMDLVRELGGGISLYQWNEAMFSRIATACDLAIIPVPLDDPLCAAKPENKLLLFWRMGMPAVVSATPAYKRTMATAGIEMACGTGAHWMSALTEYMDDEHARRDAGQRGRAYVLREYSEDKVLSRWDAALASVLAQKVGASA